MNLFFVHTPFQVLTAQNVIHKKKIRKNVLILAYTGKEAVHFYASYDLLIQPDLWEKIYRMDDVNFGTFDIRAPFISYIRLIKYTRTVKNIIRNRSISDLYFGDINHFTYIYIADKFSKMMSIHFFEEGLSHYFTTASKKRFEPSFILSLKKIITDLVYKPLGVNRFSNYFYAMQDWSFDFLIQNKFSIIPAIDNAYNTTIDFDVYVSDKLNVILDEEVEKIKSFGNLRYMLFLSSTTTVHFCDPERDESDILTSFFEKEDSSTLLVLIKYHPKDMVSKRKTLVKCFEQMGIKYLEIFRDIALPIEVFYPRIGFSKIIGYDSSSLLYARVMKPRTPVVSLLPNILAKYKHNGMKNQLLEAVWNNFYETNIKLFGKL